MSGNQTQRTASSLGGEADLFCRVAAGALAVSEVHRDEHFVAFLDHRPVFKGHTLVIPVQHAETLTDLPDALVGPLFALAKRIAAAMGPAFGADGTFVAVNNVVSQSVPHVHVHVVPRRRGDGLRGFFWPRTKYAAGEAEEFAALLAASLGNIPGDRHLEHS